MRRLLLRIGIAASLVSLAGCDGPGRVQFDGGRCFRDGRPLTAKEVEAAQANVAERIASRQPWFAVITIGIVLLAAAGNAEKLLLVVRPRHVEGQRPFLEKVRELLLRQRERPALFGTIVGGSFALIVFAGSLYIYLDIDKRANERALGMLQFCHLALRTQQEQGVLDEQRRNLQAIESTAGDIRNLVGKLPPEEQRKAQLIVDEMNGALDKQARIVGEYIERTDEAQKDLSNHTLAMEKGLASVQDELTQLRALPANLKDLQGAAHRIDETTTSFDGRLADVRSRLAALDTKLDALTTKFDSIAAKVDAQSAHWTSSTPMAKDSAKAPSPATGPAAASSHAQIPAIADGGKASL